MYHTLPIYCISIIITANTLHRRPISTSIGIYQPLTQSQRLSLTTKLSPKAALTTGIKMTAQSEEAQGISPSQQHQPTKVN